jgi:hypothetical protein
MSLRYFFEMALFGFSVFFFQIYLSQFNYDLHILNKDIGLLIEYEVLTLDLDGHILVTDDGRRVLNNYEQDEFWYRGLDARR